VLANRKVDGDVAFMFTIARMTWMASMASMSGSGMRRATWPCESLIMCLSRRFGQDAAVLASFSVYRGRLRARG
jgi:hypothetical protein